MRSASRGYLGRLEGESDACCCPVPQLGSFTSRAGAHDWGLTERSRVLTARSGMCSRLCVEFSYTWNFFRRVLTCARGMPICLEGGRTLPSQVQRSIEPESPCARVRRRKAPGVPRRYRSHFAPSPYPRNCEGGREGLWPF